MKRKYDNLNAWDEYIRPVIAENVRSVVGLISDGDTIIDVGGNTGMFTRELLKSKPNISAVVFEPIEELYAHAAIKLSDHPSVRLFPYALIETHNTGENIFSKETIYCGEKNLGWNTMLGSRLNDDNASGATEITCVGFDDLNKIMCLERIDFVKIDTEGLEYRVISGMMDAIKKFMPKMFVEIGFGQNHPHWDKEISVFEKLFEIGYQPFDIRSISGTTDVLVLPAEKK
jgi:FkbM family methyltransferase